MKKLICATGVLVLLGCGGSDSSDAGAADAAAEAQADKVLEVPAEAADVPDAGQDSPKD